MIRAGALACALLTALLLAGCASEPETVVVSSVESPPPAATVEPVRAGDGHIAGFVVDEAYRIMPGVEVRLPSFGLNDTTDRNGEFSFVDLAPGAYYLEVNHTGYEPVGSMLQVPRGDFVRVKVVLRPVPPPEPWHVTWPFDGHAPATTTSDGFIRYHEMFDVEADAGLHTIVLEAFMEPHQQGGSNGFWFRLEDHRGDRIVDGSGSAPLQVRLQIPPERLSPHYEVTLSPYGFPTPEVDKPFQVFITMFYNGAPPEGWSAVA